jgi:hypothetical protein
MVKMVLGVVIVVVGLLFLAGFGSTEEVGGSIIGGLALIAGGGVLFYFGQRARKLKRITVDLAFQMLREDDKIDARELSIRAGTDEMKVR